MEKGERRKGVNRPAEELGKEEIAITDVGKACIFFIFFAFSRGQKELGGEIRETERKRREKKNEFFVVVILVEFGILITRPISNFKSGPASELSAKA